MPATTASKPSGFRDWISTKPGARFAPEPNRYRLYTCLACPWGQGTLIVRALKGLEDVIPITGAHHLKDEGGWRFVTAGDSDIPVMCEPEPLFGLTSLRDLYLKANPEYDGQITVPVLWDTKEGTIVNNDLGDVWVMLNDMFNDYANNPDLDLYPADLRPKIDHAVESLWIPFKSAVYGCGFAKTQEVYDQAIVQVSQTLDALENRLASSRYLAGSRMTLADIRLFVLLIRFDAAYVGHFKINTERLMDYPNLSAYTRELYQNPSIRQTVSFEHIKKHYFRSFGTINPLAIVPAGPDLSYLDSPHGRDNL